MTGWSERLRLYHWPTPATDYDRTTTLMAPWFQEAGELSHRLLDIDNWTSTERSRAAELAWEVLKWGGVTRQPEFSEVTVERVFRKALWLSPLDHPPMNSGWTKVAALATAFLEDEPDGVAHVIWDSRVSTSLISRLEQLLIKVGDTKPKSHFPGIGPSPGRGGSRPRPLKSDGRLTAEGTKSAVTRKNTIKRSASGTMKLNVMMRGETPIQNSGSSDRKVVWVQVSSSAPTRCTQTLELCARGFAVLASSV